MKSVEGNADRQKNIEVRRLIDDADLRHQPLEILEQEISVFEKTEHAQIHTDTGHQPDAAGPPLGLGDLPPEPEIHRGRGKKERGERRVPSPVKNVARGDEKIFPRGPGADAPIEHHHDHEEDDKGERIEKHRRKVRLLYAGARTETSTIFRIMIALSIVQPNQARLFLKQNDKEIIVIGVVDVD